MLEKIKEKFNQFTEKMVKVQTSIFINLSYFTAILIGNLYLRSRNKLYHENGGFFQEPENKKNTIERYRKQY